VTTDAPIAAPLLKAALRDAVDRTFNQVTVDGDPSTNDTVLVLASGAEGGPPITSGTALSAFRDGLETVCRSLAQQVAADGEGAEHRIDVAVVGARNDREARRVARTVAGSSLVKTAVHGGDPNWGRIAAAAGRAGVPLDPGRLAVRIGPIAVYDGGPLAFDDGAASAALRGSVVEIGLDLRLGTGAGVAWGCDLSAGYVAINSEYRT
jgi:glutamate N-acetyltransferase / amino-acid N-acetyltransferase